MIDLGVNVNAVSKAGVTPYLAAHGDGDRLGGVLYNKEGAELLLKHGADTGKSISSAGLLRLEVFSSSAQLRPGEQLVTFGSADGTPYVAGVPVGVITQVEDAGSSLMRQALVRPYVTVATIGVVGVVVAPPRTNPRDSVLPPPPAPAPTVTVTATATATPSSTATAKPAATATPGSGG